MALHDEEFELGIVTVEVTTTTGECHIEDWNPKDTDEALDYAEATAHCSDVSKTVYTDVRSGSTRTFENQANSALRK